MRDEQFGFRPRQSTSLQLARLVQRITRNLCGKRLKDAVFLDMAKAFDTVWIYGLLYKLTILNFPSYIVLKSHRTSGVGLRGDLPDGHVISSRHAGWCGSGWIDLPFPLQSVRQRQALTLAPRRVSPLGGWHGSHSHVPQADAARQYTWSPTSTTFNGGWANGESP